MRILFFILFSFIITKSLYAIEFKGNFIQGSFILGKTEPNTKVIIDKTEIKVSKNGFFAFGIGKDRKNDNENDNVR